MGSKKHDENCWCEKCLVKWHDLEPVIDGPERWWDPIQGNMRTYSWEPHLIDIKAVKDER